MPHNVEQIGNNFRSQLPAAQDVDDLVQFPVPTGDDLQQIDQPNDQHHRMEDIWRMTFSLMEGTRAMREEGRRFLPQEEKEKHGSYNNRLKRSVLFGAYKKTITTSTGRPFSRPMTFEGFNAELLRLNEDIDLQGNNIDVFARKVFLSGLAHGHVFVYVDHPKRPDIQGESNDAPSLEDQRSLNLRPFWRMVQARDVIGWRSAIVGGREIPIQIRIRERTTRPTGMFTEGMFERIRVLEPGFFRLYEKNEENEWVLIDSGMYIDAAGNLLNFIPFVPFYANAPEEFYVTTPPLVDLGFMNVLHWQSSSDQENLLHVARVPILFSTGFDDDRDFVIGASHYISGPPGSTLQYVEPEGTAISAGRESLEDLENRMRIMGAEVLVRDPARVTATQKVLDTDEATSELQDIVIRYEDFLAQCYTLTGIWMGLDENAVGEITLFKDFGVSAKTGEEANQLLQARLAKQITQETFLKELKRRGLLGDDVDVEAEALLTDQEQQEAREFMNAQFDQGSGDDDE